MSAVKDRGEKNREKRMSLGAHLIELRKRLFISAIAIVVGMALGWWLTDAFVWQAIQEPVEQVAEAQGSDTAIIFPTISSAFDLRLQIAFTLGIVISSPVWLYQIFAFLVPGLNTRERQVHVRLLRHRHPAVLRRMRRGLVRPAEHRAAHDELRARGRRVAAHREGVHRLRTEAGRRDRRRLRRARVHRAAELRRRHQRRTRSSSRGESRSS